MQFEQIFEQHSRKLMVDELISKGEKCRKEVKIFQSIINITCRLVIWLIHLSEITLLKK